MRRAAEEAGLSSNVASVLPHGVTAHSRTDGEKTYIFVENYMEQAASVELNGMMEDLLTGGVTDRVTLPPYGFAVFKSK